MKALIVYDSVFGNTEKIAQAMARGLPGAVEVQRVDGVDMDQLSDVSLLVVGSPTRAFRATEGIRAFLKAIPAGKLNGVDVAAFDTRIDISKGHPWILRVMVRLFGYAAEPIAKALTAKGGKLVFEPAWFFVEGKEGPLRDGEESRAAAWLGQSIKSE